VRQCVCWVRTLMRETVLVRVCDVVMAWWQTRLRHQLQMCVFVPF
jgi:hypothetical protein